MKSALTKIIYQKQQFFVLFHKEKIKRKFEIFFCYDENVPFYFFPIEKWSRKLPRIFLLVLKKKGSNGERCKGEEKLFFRHLTRETFDGKLFTLGKRVANVTYVCIPHENCDPMTFLI